MKKVLSLVLVVLMCLTFAACGESAGNGDVVETPTTTTTAPSAESKVLEYIQKNEATILNSFEEGFSASGMTCRSSLKAEGTGFVVNVNINELQNVDAATKAALQQTYDAMSSSFDSMLSLMKTELPELTYFVFNICDADGNLLAAINAGNK